LSAFENVYVGVAGWSYEDWKDVVYPASEKNRLGYIAQFFDCVEINSSFYRPATQRMAEKWVQDVQENEAFMFSAKLYSRFTHDFEKAYPDQAEVNQVKQGFQPLQAAGRLLTLLIQFPFYFRDSEKSRERLKRIATDFAEFPKSVELRDSSWAQPDALAFLREQGLNVVCLDMPLTRRSFREKAVTTGDIGYLRLHGRNYDAWFNKEAERDQRYNYLYSGKEMDFTVHRIEELSAAAEKTVVVWNNHFHGKAAVNALQTLSRLKGAPVDAPEPLQKAYPGANGVGFR